MNKAVFSTLAIFALFMAAGGTPKAQASEGAVHPAQQSWHFDGFAGTYDRGALQRGYKVYREVCAACHSMKRVHFRNLEALGYDESQIKTIASGYNVTDGPNDEGDMYERPARPSDAFPSPFPNKNAAKFANGGAAPPDLSLITKARHDGPNYVFSLLTGYEEPPHGEMLNDGQHWNKYFPGHKLAMAPPLSDDQVAYEDGTPQTVEQYARDVTEFLTWAADPYMEERKRTGRATLIFLLVLAGIMYAVKRRIWADQH
jgi:ubiquinol-cytochrome c reductase cytochrome c1 subunit